MRVPLFRDTAICLAVTVTTMGNVGTRAARQEDPLRDSYCKGE